MTISVGNEVVVIGGESAGRTAAHDEVEAFDVTTFRWRTLQPLQQGRHSGGIARLGNNLHVEQGL